MITSQIVDALARGDFSFRRFYIARLRRIFPALAVVCVASLLFGWLIFLPFDYLATTRHVLAAVFFLSNLAFTGEQGYFDVAAHLKPMLHTWSLSVEGQFYVFLPIGMALAWRFPRRQLLIPITVAFLMSLGWCLYAGRVNAGDTFYLLSARSWEFLVGSLLALWRRPATLKVRVGNAGSVVSLGLLLLCFVFLNPSLQWPGYWTLLPVGAAVALIAMREAPLTLPLLKSWPVQRLGDLSYSFYLWHWPVLVFAKQYVLTLERELSTLELAGLLVLSLFLAVLSWRFVESPVRSRRGWWTSRRAWGGLAGAMALMFSITLPIIATKGAAQRLPDYVQRASVAVFLNTPRDECFRRSDSTKDAPERFCSFGRVGAEEPSLILWGDSHANQYLTAVSQAATAVGLAGLIATQGACRANLPGRPTGLPPELVAGCERFITEVHDFVTQTASVKTVIIGLQWTGLTGGFEGTVALVRDLVSAGKTVVLIGPVPAPHFNVPQRWSRQQLRAGQAIESMTVTASSQSHQRAAHDELLVLLGEQINARKVVVLDPMARLCDGAVCRLIENGVSFYRDTAHLSEAGALLFTEDFAKALQTVTP